MNMVKNISDIRSYLNANDVDTSFFDTLDPKISIGILNKTPSFYLLKVKTDSEYITIVFDESSVILNKAVPYSTTNTAPPEKPAGTIKTGNEALDFVEDIRIQNLDILTIQNLRHDDHINRLSVELYKYMKFYIAKLKKLPNINQLHTEHSNYLSLVHELNLFIDKLLSFHKSFNLTNMPPYFNQWESNVFENATKILTHIVLFDFLSQANLILQETGEKCYVENYNDITNPVQTTECALDDLWKSIVLIQRVYKEPTNLDSENPDNYIIEEDFQKTNALSAFNLYDIIKFEDKLIFDDDMWWNWIKEELIKKIGGEVVGIPFEFFSTFFNKLNSLKTRYELITGKMNGLVLRNALWKAIHNQASTNEGNIFTLPEIHEFEQEQFSPPIVETKDLGHLGFNSIISLLNVVHDLPAWNYHTKTNIVNGINNNDSTLRLILNRIKFNKDKRNPSGLSNNINLAWMKEVEYREGVVNNVELVTSVDLSNKRPDVLDKVDQDTIRNGFITGLEAQQQTNTIMDNIEATIFDNVMLVDPSTQRPQEGQTENIASLADVEVADFNTVGTTDFQIPANEMKVSELKIIQVQPMQATGQNVYTQNFIMTFR